MTVCLVVQTFGQHHQKFGICVGNTLDQCGLQRDVALETERQDGGPNMES